MITVIAINTGNGSSRKGEYEGPAQKTGAWPCGIRAHLCQILRVLATSRGWQSKRRSWEGPTDMEISGWGMRTLRGKSKEGEDHQIWWVLIRPWLGKSGCMLLRPPHWPLASMPILGILASPRIPTKCQWLWSESAQETFQLTVLAGLVPGASFLNWLKASFFICEMVRMPVLQEDLFMQWIFTSSNYRSGATVGVEYINWAKIDAVPSLRE